MMSFERHRIHTHVWLDVNTVIKRIKIDSLICDEWRAVGGMTLANCSIEKLSSC